MLTGIINHETIENNHEDVIDAFGTEIFVRAFFASEGETFLNIVMGV